MTIVVDLLGLLSLLVAVSANLQFHGCVVRCWQFLDLALVCLRMCKTKKPIDNSAQRNCLFVNRKYIYIYMICIDSGTFFFKILIPKPRGKMRCEVLSVLGFGMEVHIGYHNIDNCSFCSRQCELLCFDLGVNSIALSVPVHTKNGCNAACSWCTVSM